MKIKFSVIIPAYNAEATITRCLNSILKSNRLDIEIIVINDGSTDHTGEICQEIAQRDHRVNYIEKQNGGVSSARNKGIEVAKGEIVCFVDSDDFVTENYFECIDEEMTLECDLLMFGKAIFDGEEYYCISKKLCYYTNKRKLVDTLSKMFKKQQLNSIWNKVYKLQIIKENNIYFPEQLSIGEDKIFVIKYITCIENFKSITDNLYIVSVENKNSLSRKIRENLCNDVILEHEILLKHINESNLESYIKRKYLNDIYFSLYRSAYTVINEINKYYISEEEKIKKSKQVCKKYAQIKLKPYCDIQTKIIALPIQLGMLNIINLILRKKVYNYVVL